MLTLLPEKSAISVFVQNKIAQVSWWCLWRSTFGMW